MKVLLLINPNSGPKSIVNEIEKFIPVLTENGYQVTKSIPYSTQEARKFLKNAVENKFNLVITAGGDGTINTAANVLAKTGIPLAIIPTGTANVLAKELNLPRRKFGNSDFIIKNIDLILIGRKKEIDLGKVTFENSKSKYFAMWCGIGLDALLTDAKKTPPDKLFRRKLNYINWALSMISLTFKFKGADVTYELNNKTKNDKLIQILVSNGSFYANYFKVSERAKIDDGILDITFLKNNMFSLSLFLIRSIIKRDFFSDMSRQSKEIIINSKDPLPVHVDAETCGTTPIKIKVEPKALKVIY